MRHWWTWARGESSVPAHFAMIGVRNEAGRAGAGVEHGCADRSRTPDVGEELVPGLTDEGSKFQVNFHVTDFDRPLIKGDCGGP